MKIIDKISSIVKEYSSIRELDVEKEIYEISRELEYSTNHRKEDIYEPSIEVDSLLSSAKVKFEKFYPKVKLDYSGKVIAIVGKPSDKFTLMQAISQIEKNRSVITVSVPDGSTSEDLENFASSYIKIVENNSTEFKP